jgi:[acyl-carrier-protein] S-malonyltransferase
MAAILGLDYAAVVEIAAEAAGDEVCHLANDNDPAQMVISGHRGAVERACEIAKARGAKRALMLPVSAPFHCALMEPAAAVMGEALAAVVIRDPIVPVVVNVRAEAVEDADRVRALLVAQVTGEVRWRESVQWLVRAEVREFWEIGAGKALSGMIRRIEKETVQASVGTPADILALKG